MRDTLIHLFLGLLLTTVSVFVVVHSHDFWSWTALVFFGLITFMHLFKLVFPDTTFLKNIRTNSGINEKSFDEIYEDNGIFTFKEDGFKVSLKNEQYDIQWEGIKTILGYKIDLYATDCICAEIFCDNGKSFAINEETKGWFQFQRHLKERLPAIDKGWDIEISVPAFETNLTLVYDRDNRTLEEVIKQE